MSSSRPSEMCNRGCFAPVLSKPMKMASCIALPTAFVLALGCSRKDDGPTLAPAASALPVSRTESAGTWHFTIDPKGTAHVEMPGLKENIRGDTSAVLGTIDVVPNDLSQSRGMVRVDLSTFSTHTFGTDQDATQTKHARTWLEVVVDGKTNDEMRWADFAIRSMEVSGASELTKVAVVREGNDDVRRVTLTAHGDLLVHGHKVDKDAFVDVAFHYPVGAAATTRPTRIEVKSKQPLRVVLKEHRTCGRGIRKASSWRGRRASLQKWPRRPTSPWTLPRLRRREFYRTKEIRYATEFVVRESRPLFWRHSGPARSWPVLASQPQPVHAREIPPVAPGAAAAGQASCSAAGCGAKKLPDTTSAAPSPAAAAAPGTTAVAATPAAVSAAGRLPRRRRPRLRRHPPNRQRVRKRKLQPR